MVTCIEAVKCVAICQVWPAHAIEILNALDQRVEVEVSPVAVRGPLLRILQHMADLDAQIPREEYEKVPTDLAQNLDHYLYGAKKAG